MRLARTVEILYIMLRRAEKDIINRLTHNDYIFWLIYCLIFLIANLRLRNSSLEAKLISQFVIRTCDSGKY